MRPDARMVTFSLPGDAPGAVNPLNLRPEARNIVPPDAITPSITLNFRMRHNMNDLTLIQLFLGLVFIYWGVVFIGAVIWLIGKLRKGPEIF